MMQLYLYLHLLHMARYHCPEDLAAYNVLDPFSHRLNYHLPVAWNEWRMCPWHTGSILHLLDNTLTYVLSYNKLFSPQWIFTTL
jgi:hypothetical protein